ncbi:MAG TPA: hypothetical protein VGU02_02910, partial [Gaiellaceae bacterium]|nr:hypothetical protein [Gaiellaceae bacterium]
MLMMVIGIVVYGGGAGTFATFSAETANTNSSVSSGTLTMSDAVTGGQTCFSASSGSSAITADNINDLPSQQTLNGSNTTTALGACDQIMSITNVAPGAFAGVSTVTISNTGSLDAGKLKMFAPYVNTALNTAGGATITLGTNLSTAGLTVLPLEGPIKSGDTLEIDYGTKSQQVTAGANVGPLKTAIPISGNPTASFAMPIGTRVVDLSTDGITGGNQQNIDCFDVRNSTAQSVGATAGTDLNFNNKTNEQDATTHWVTDSTATYTGPLCANLGFFIQEQTTVNGSTYNYCWYGDGATSTTHATANGACIAPSSVSLGTNAPTLPQTTTPGSVSFTGTLKGNVVTGDTITISELSKTNITCTAAADAYIGATGSMSLKSCSASGSGATTAALISDTTALTDLSTDTQTLANFQTLHGANNQLELPTLVANGALAASGANVTSVELGKTGSVGSATVGSPNVGSAPASRKFYVGIYLPSGTASAQNSFQGLKSTFGLGWHIDQF